MGYPESNPNGTTLENFLRSVQKGQENVIDVQKMVTPEGKEAIVVCLGNRALQPEQPKAPERAESPRRSHVFHAMEGFCAYLKDVKTEHTVVFADVAAGLFQAVIDDRSPKGFETVGMHPQVHPLWKPWAEIIRNPQMVKDFAKFLLANRRQLSGEKAKELISDFSQVRAAAEVTMESGTGKNCINGLMIRTKIHGARDSETYELPDSFTVHAPLFVGLEATDIEIDILLEPADPTGASGVIVNLSSADATTKIIEAFETMCQQVKAEVPEIVVTMGQPNHDAWDYIWAAR